MTINLQTGGYVPQPLPGARSADIQVGQKQSQNDTVISATAAPEQPRASSPEDRRYEQVLQAAQNFVPNLYPVGDKKFSIFKDASGQYVVRTVSLRDGSVKYFPEEVVVRSATPAVRSGGESLVSIQA